MDIGAKVRRGALFERLSLFAMIPLLVLAVCGCTGSRAVCDLYAASGGSDGADGTKRSPFHTAQKLADSLGRGQSGCLGTGTYIESDAELEIANAEVTLRSVPGQRATIRARVYVPEGADRVVVRNLDLDGSDTNLPSPTVNADHTRWIGNNVTNHHSGVSCFLLGHSDYGTAFGTLIQDNRVHDCGRLPRTNLDHGIYLNNARDTRIIANQIYGNADRGIQLRSDTQRTLIRHNIVDGNGQGILFSGNHGVAAGYTTVENNIISFSEARNNVESFYPAGTPAGKHNLVRGNCIHGGVYDDGDGGIQSPQVGFTARRNILRSPLYVNRASNDFRLREGSPCKSILRGRGYRSLPLRENSSRMYGLSPES